MSDGECTWQAFGGSRDVAITCLAAAGSRRVAIGGSGGKLEVWDVEVVYGGGGIGEAFGVGGAGVGGRAGLVHRLVSFKVFVLELKRFAFLHSWSD